MMTESWRVLSPSVMSLKQHSVAAGIIYCNMDTDLMGRMTMQVKLRIAEKILHSDDQLHRNHISPLI